MLDLAVAIIALAVWYAARSVRYLHIFQQEEYDRARFLRWVFAGGNVDKVLTVAIAAILALDAAAAPPPFVAPALIAVAFGASATLDLLALRGAKKKFVPTKRAKRILVIAYLIGVALGAAGLFAVGPWWLLAAIHFAPVSLTIADRALAPYERRLQAGFADLGRAAIADSGATIVGVTGSFGKTSVKHILDHVLSSSSRSLATPGSVNTLMGITRFARENLTKSHDYFIAEMGAYGVGSIASLCRLAPPDAAILTAVGPAHYERFKSLEAVAIAKMEIVEAALAKPNGFAIIEEEVLRFAHVRDIVAPNRDRVFIAGTSDAADLQVLGFEQTQQGLEIQLRYGETHFEVFAPIFGSHHVSNIAIVTLTALKLGLTIERIRAALRLAKQIRHRLEVGTHGTGARLIDDAYNSNPKGFRAALELLSKLQTQGGRRILTTPGMVELGARHDEEHASLGDYARAHVDVLLAVAPERQEAFIDAIQADNADLELHRMATFAEAAAWMDANATARDVILLENDLPDLYETRMII